MLSLRFVAVFFMLYCGFPPADADRSSAMTGVCPCDADVNNDGVVNVLDWACIQDCKGGACTCCVDTCDVNCDGVVDATDAGNDPFNDDSMWHCRFVGIAADSCCGSCCDVSGGVCTDDIIENDCPGVNQSWYQGLRCAEVSCTSASTGACCDLNYGTCQNGVTQAACTGANVMWVQGQTCTSASCPTPPTGACCNYGNGQCSDAVLEINCLDPDQVWSESILCTAIGCSVPPQYPCPCDADVDNNGVINALDWACIQDCKAGNCACCVDTCDVNCDGVVNDTDAGDDPQNEESMWQCQFVGRPATQCCGSCCNDAAGNCTDDVIRDDCANVDQSWYQAQRCVNVPCDSVPVGACCNVDYGTCQENTTQASCTGANLSWFESMPCNNTTCPMPPSGACCNQANGHCFDGVFAVDCADPNRSWTPSTSCSAVGCSVPPQDPCPCNGDVNGTPPVNFIDVATVVDCVNDDCGGCAVSCDTNCTGYVDYIDMGVTACQFQGFSDCCNRPYGACMGGQNVPPCIITLEAGCDVLQGTYWGDNTNCGSVPGSVIAAGSGCATNANCNPIPGGEGVCISGKCHTPFNRYLQFYASPLVGDSTAQAVRVTFTKMPGPADCVNVPDYSAFENDSMWVGLPHTTTGVSRLVGSPVFRDWGTDLIKVSDCNIVPCASYTIEVEGNSPDSPPGSMSPPILFRTPSRWGDLTGRSAGILSAPDGGAPDFVDIGTVVDRFKNMPGVPASERLRCDICENVPTQGGGTPNVDFFDIGCVVDAFKGLPYDYSIQNSSGQHGPAGSGGTCALP